jgi:pyruvate/2-oxoglutarate dehydrogenase complex dihydrolipoamide dehydrogenase (E3) component
MEYDSIVIGAGQAGPSMARRLAAAGRRVAMIERARFGGTCVNTGCTPTKTMIASAYAAHLARRGAEFGVTIEGRIGVDMRAVRARKERVVEVSRKAIEASLRGTENITVFNDHARFVSAHEVAVGQNVLSAREIFINVGARPSVPAIPGLNSCRYLTSSSIIDLDEVPRHLIVIGGSYVGLEFAQMFRRFGADVSVIETAPSLIGREDPEISEAVLGILQGEGITVQLASHATGVRQNGSVIAVDIEDAAGSQTLVGSHLLVAVGRQPNTDDLGTDRAGITLDQRGYIEVDDALRTGVDGIWALGECNGHGAFTHTAYNDFEIVAGNLLDGETRKVTDRIVAYALFTDPPLGRAGITEAGARKTRRNVLTGSIPMEDVSRAYEKGETLGLMKLVVDGDTREILGAAFLGTGGDEAVHCLLDLMYAKAPYTLLRRVVHIHPTVAEFIPSLLDGLTGP